LTIGYPYLFEIPAVWRLFLFEKGQLLRSLLSFHAINWPFSYFSGIICSFVDFPARDGILVCQLSLFLATVLPSSRWFDSYLQEFAVSSTTFTQGSLFWFSRLLSVTAAFSPLSFREFLVGLSADHPQVSIFWKAHASSCESSHRPNAAILIFVIDEGVYHLCGRARLASI
jgi:hypothetical protein